MSSEKDIESSKSMDLSFQRQLSSDNETLFCLSSKYATTYQSEMNSSQIIPNWLQKIYQFEKNFNDETY